MLRENEGYKLTTMKAIIIDGERMTSDGEAKQVNDLQ